MTREEIIDLLTLARVYDARVTLGKAEAAAWYLALNRVPTSAGHAAVVAHYTAPVQPGQEYPRIAPGHVTAYWQAANRPDDKPVPALPAAKASPEHVAACKAQIQAAVDEAAARFALDQHEPADGIPRFRPGMDKRKLALAQVEASRRARGEALA